MSVKKILVAEDHPVLSDFYEMVLKEKGYSVTVCLNGEQALGEYKKAAESGEPFDLVLTDIEMPGLDGYQLIEAIRAIKKDQPIIANSGNEGKQRRAEELNVTFLSKPVSLTDLYRAVSKALGEGV